MPYSARSGRERPLYEIKANLFKALAHPARIRVLEVLSASDDPVPVSELLKITGLEATLLSQHLSVLRRHLVVNSNRVGNAVFYQLAHEQVADLLVIARSFLADTLASQRDQLQVVESLPPVTAG